MPSKDMENNDESDMDLLLNVMEVLENREKENNNCHFTDTETALKQFYERYQTPQEATNDYSMIQSKETGKRIKPVWLRFTAVAALVAIVLLVGTVTGNAVDYNIWENAKSWTKETFSFQPGEQIDGNILDLCELSKTLADYRITEQLLPKWLPEQYSFDDVYVYESPVLIRISFQGKAGDHKLIIHVIKQLDEKDNASQYFEITEGTLDTYKSHDVVHYIAKNAEHVCVFWERESVEVSLDFSDTGIESCINRIIESIYEE